MKINTVIDGKEIIIEGTVEEIEALFKEDEVEQSEVNNTNYKDIKELENGVYYVKGKILDSFGDSVEDETVTVDNMGDYIIFRPENHKDTVMINTTEEKEIERVIQNAELVELESDNKQEEDVSDFKEGDIVEILEEVSGVEKGNYGIIISVGLHTVIVAGYSKLGIFSREWTHKKEGLKLIKRT